MEWMNTKKTSAKLRATTQAFLVCGALLSSGCGGGGGSDTPLALSPAAAPSQVSPAAPAPAPAATPEVARTFGFPTFGANSRLTVVANFQTEEETPNTTGRLTASVQDLLGGLPLARIATRQASREDEAITDHCGYADVCALHELLEEDPIRAQQVNTEILPRFQELAAGERRDFFVVPAFEDITAERVLEPFETEHCTIFAEVLNDEPVLSRQRALAIAEAFDSNNPERLGSGIYDQIRDVFGSEWNQNPPGGNDGDDKIVMFFFSAETLGASLFGFVSPADGNPNGGSTSNQGEIIYISADKSDYQTLATIAHEFQHLVLQNQKINQQGINPASARSENVAVNEGLSGLAEDICGYSLESGNRVLASVVNSYLARPDEHEFFDFFESGLGYGQGYLFFRYVREHYGDSLIRAIATDTNGGMSNLNDHLPAGFAETFHRWTVANYATNLSGPVPNIFRYPSGFRTDGTFPAGRLVGPSTSPLNTEQSVQTPALNPWSTSYLTLENGTDEVGVTTTVTPAPSSPFSIIFELNEDGFSELRR